MVIVALLSALVLGFLIILELMSEIRRKEEALYEAHVEIDKLRTKIDILKGETK